MNAVSQFVVTVLTAALCLPSVAFVLWLVTRIQKKKKLGAPFTRRIRSAVISVLIVLGACAAVTVVSRSLETYSTDGPLISASMIAAYAFYAFVAANLVALAVLLLLWAFALLVKAPNSRTSAPP